MSLSIETIASRISWSTSFSGRWSLISWCVRKPRVLPILMSVFSSWRRLATSSSVSAVSSRPNSRISARSLARETFMRSGLALAARRHRRPARPRDRPRSPTGRRPRLPAWRPCRRPCPLAALPLAAGPLPLAGADACGRLRRPSRPPWRASWSRRSTAALAGLAAGWRLWSGRLSSAVMQILGRWWACGSGGPNQELRTCVREFKVRVSRVQMRRTARATRNPKVPTCRRAVAG